MSFETGEKRAFQKISRQEITWNPTCMTGTLEWLHLTIVVLLPSSGLCIGSPIDYTADLDHVFLQSSRLGLQAGHGIPSGKRVRRRDRCPDVSLVHMQSHGTLGVYGRQCLSKFLLGVRCRDGQISIQ